MKTYFYYFIIKEKTTSPRKKLCLIYHIRERRNLSWKTSFVFIIYFYYVFNFWKWHGITMNSFHFIEEMYVSTRTFSHIIFLYTLFLHKALRARASPPPTPTTTKRESTYMYVPKRVIHNKKQAIWRGTHRLWRIMTGIWRKSRDLYEKWKHGQQT